MKSDGYARLHFGDNVEVLEQLFREDVKIDLAYLDPPFYTNRVFETSDGEIAYDDRWPSRTAWLNAVGRRISAIHRLMQPHASIIIHVTPRISHLIKGFCDRLFGENAFVAEIVWRYRRWPSPGTNFQRVHDVLIQYRKAYEPKRWNQLYEPLSDSTLKTWGTKKQAAIFEDGKRKKSSTLEEESKGVPMGDVWDIPIIAPVSKERTGYPTQKPEALLERVIGALSYPGDVVLDPYMGSGTTVAVARRMNRFAIGIDSSKVAFNVASKRIFPKTRRRSA